MSYELQKPTFDITKGRNIVSFLKLWGSQVSIGIVVSLVLLLVISLGNNLGAWLFIPMFLIVIAGQVYLATLFEYWDGCYKKVE